MKNISAIFFIVICRDAECFQLFATDFLIKMVYITLFHNVFVISYDYSCGP